MARHIEVVGAVIIREGVALCVQRGPNGALPGMWEFPGGKIEPDEAPKVALAREIHEELHCIVAVGGLVTTTTHDYSFGTVRLTTYYCDVVEGEPTLTEHADMLWARPSQLRNLSWAAADVPAVELVLTAMAE
jgi:8-oxo-dGTP diphosphatase